jgi:tetratricopeptide (TPR) repeat protein
MSLPVLFLIIGFAYVLVWGGLSLLRREGLSLRFALEAVAITLVFSGLAAWTGFQPHPVLVLLLIYLITMRARLLVDLATYFAQRKQYKRADTLYNIAKRLWPDPCGRLIIQLNQGVSFLQRSETDQAIAAFKAILQKAGEGNLGIKNEAATHYNLGVAYLRKNQNPQAVVEFNAVLNTWPASEYARRAATALENIRHSDVSAAVELKK